MTNSRVLRASSLWRGSSLAAVLWVAVPWVVSGCESDDNGGGESRGGIVGFSTGTPAVGPVPSDGTSAQAPVIEAAELQHAEIAFTEPLTLTITFSDGESDVSTINFGIDGEPSHYTLSSGLAAGQSSGVLVLELYPDNPIAGHYVLLLSLTDAAGNTSQAQTVPFTIRESDGSVPSVGTGGTGGEATQNNTGGQGPAAPTFLMVSDSDSDELPGSLVRVTVASTQPNIEVLTSLVPKNKRTDSADLRDGRFAMLLDGALAEEIPEGRAPIVAFDLSAPSQPWFAPIPEAEGLDFFTIDSMRPQVLADGRVVYSVTYQTENPYDDHHERQLAIWDPISDALVLQGELSSFVLSQPEIAACNCDAEDGSLGASGFSASPDGSSVYFGAYAYGTEAGIYHVGPFLLGRYDVLTGANERMAYTDAAATPWAVSGDGSRVVVGIGSAIHHLDPAMKTLTEYDPAQYVVLTGQMSRGST